MKRSDKKSRGKQTKKTIVRKKATPAKASRSGRRLSISDKELEALRNKLMEAQETLEAIRTGAVDAVVISGAQGNQVYSLAGAEQPYRVYVEQMQEGAVTVSSDALILYCNQTFANMLQTPLERVISSNLTDFLEPGVWQTISGVFNREGIVVKQEAALKCVGRELPVHLTASRLPMDDQEVMCLVVTDASGLKEKAELHLAKEVAEKANLAKDDFLAALSHELRTPLNPVLLLASEGADNFDLPPGARADFASIRNSIELEARLIDDLLDLTRIANGKLHMEVVPLDPHAALQQALQIVTTNLEQKRITLIMDLKAGDCRVQGDIIRLQQVFWNIFNNAIKFTPERGTITVSTRKNEKDRTVSVIISDTGVGMSAKDLDRIFKVFAQGDNAGQGTHRFGGLGLGLTISRRLVEAHAGTIEARSDGPHLGASFTVTLPLAERQDLTSSAPSGANRRAEVAGAPPKGTRILLIEDHEPTRVTLARLLVRRNYHVLMAASVGEARDLARQQTYDLVISDIGLPDGNGFDLMKELGANYGLKGIALTGYGMEHDIERSQAAGFVAHLIKPVRVQSLEAALAALNEELTS